MRKIVVLAAILLGAMLASVALVRATDTIVYTRGDERVVPGQFVSSDLRFSPRPIAIGSGDTVTWTHADNTEAPHTVTIINQNELPQSFEELFMCPSCEAALDGHFSTGPVLDPDADGQFSSPGDSVLFLPGQTVSFQINADPGTTLYYLCSIHPWMQGSIKVIK